MLIRAEFLPVAEVQRYLFDNVSGLISGTEYSIYLIVLLTVVETRKIPTAKKFEL